MKKIKKYCKQTFPKIYDFLVNIKLEMKYKKKKKLNPKDYSGYLEKEYERVFGIKFDINNPRTYTEKIQWMKLKEATPLKSLLTDKVEVRKWVEERLQSDKYFIPFLGIYDSFDDIDFNKLPDKFVIKTSHSSGWNMIVKDKSILNIKKTEKKFKKWLKMDFSYWSDLEIHYSRIKPRIIIEEYKEDESGELKDYKFLCFNGMVKYCWVDVDRAGQHKRNVYDLDWNLQEWNQSTYGNYVGEVKKPKNFDKMIKISEILCHGFNHVRVDLYNINGDIFFGEMTFTNGGGFESINPYKYDVELGDMISL